MNICQVIFSTNRLEYLTRTLEAQANLDFGEHTVHKIFFDDYPKGRNNRLIRMLAEAYGYTEIILHEENQGITKTWTEFFDLIRPRNYDYIWHQEDDVLIKHPVKIDDLIDMMEDDQRIVQTVLKRQPWYSWDDTTLIKDTDIRWNHYLLERHSDVFSIIASLYPGWVVREDYTGFYNFSLNEGMIMKYLEWKYPHSCNVVVKNGDGTPLIEHIGEYFQGKRLCPNEPNWEYFNYERFDPNKKYSSRTGYLLEDSQ